MSTISPTAFHLLSYLCRRVEALYQLVPIQAMCVSTETKGLVAMEGREQEGNLYRLLRFYSFHLSSPAPLCPSKKGRKRFLGESGNPH
jgi:hypothetical protein